MFTIHSGLTTSSCLPQSAADVTSPSEYLYPKLPAMRFWRRYEPDVAWRGEEILLDVVACGWRSLMLIFERYAITSLWRTRTGLLAFSGLKKPIFSSFGLRAQLLFTVPVRCMMMTMQGYRHPSALRNVRSNIHWYSRVSQTTRRGALCYNDVTWFIRS